MTGRTLNEMIDPSPPARVGPITDDRRAYRPRDIARMYSVAPQTVYAWIYQGKLKANRIGRVLLVPAEEVERWFSGEVAA